MTHRHRSIIKKKADDDYPDKIRVKLEYLDRQENLLYSIEGQFPLETKISDLTKRLTKFVFGFFPHDDCCPVRYISSNGEFRISRTDSDKSLFDLNIADGATIRFRKVSRYKSYDFTNPMKVLGPNRENILIAWDEDETTLKMFLDEIVNKLHFHWIDRDRLHLFNSFEELDFISNPDQLLSEWNVAYSSFVSVRIIPELTDEDYRVNGFVRLVYDNTLSEPFKATIVSVESTFSQLITVAKELIGENLDKRIQFEYRRKILNEQNENLRLIDMGIEAGQQITMKTIFRSSFSIDSPGCPSVKRTTLSSETSASQSLPVGLGNLGNSCFMNSALQCLAHIKPFTDFFVNQLNQSEENSYESFFDDQQWNRFHEIGSVTGSYADLIKHLWMKQTKEGHFINRWRYFRPESLKQAIGLVEPRFNNWDQHDAQEFMIYLLDSMNKEFQEKNKQDSETIVEQLFFGEIQSTMKCSSCSKSQTTIDRISLIPLQINHGPIVQWNIEFIDRQGQQSSAIISHCRNGQIKDLIQEFRKDRVQSYFYEIHALVDDCSLDPEKSLESLDTRSLIFVETHEFYRETSRWSNDTDQKTLSLKQCLEQFCSVEPLEDPCFCRSDCQTNRLMTRQITFRRLPRVLIIQLKRFSSKFEHTEKLESFVDFPIDSFELNFLLGSPEQNETECSSVPRLVYDLIAVVNHTGLTSFGHYTAFARRHVNDGVQWYSFNDSFVTEISSTSKIVTRDAYLLFYINRDSNQ